MTKGPPLLVVNCGQLLTLQGAGRPRAGTGMAELGLIRRGAVLIRNGTIESAGTEQQVARMPGARKALRLDARGQVVMPGFVDSHTHALFPAPRLEEYIARISGETYERIARAGGGIQVSARRLRSTNVSVLVERLETVAGLFLEHGTTTAEIKSGYGLTPSQELKMLRVIGMVAGRSVVELVPTLLIQDVPAHERGRRSGFVKRLVRQVIPQVARHQLAEFCDVFSDRGYFSLAESKRLLSAAKKAGLKCKMHAEQLGRSGAATMAARLGAVSVDHLDHVTDADIRALRDTHAIATLLPGSNFHLGWSAYPKARRLMGAGIPVALATNFNPGTSPTFNMQMVLTLACSHMHMLPEEAITAATINGAYAISRGNRLGSLEPGKQADLVIMDVADYREIPYFFGVNHCETVVKKGRVVWSKHQRSTGKPKGR